jgi:hypothetical protein
VSLPRPLSSLPSMERDRRLAVIASAIAHVLRPDLRASVASRQQHHAAVAGGRP